MAEQYSIAQVSRITGLPAHTLRYYEQQFPHLLEIERSPGGHRIYREHHLATINRVIKLLKDDKMSIRQARELLGEIEPGTDEKATVAETNNDANTQLETMLQLVLQRLDLLCLGNERRDQLLLSLLKNEPGEEKRALLEQIGRCRKESRETVKLCQMLIKRGVLPNQNRNN